MKIYIICCVPAQFLYWEISFYWNTDQNALSQSGCRIFEWSISPEQSDEVASFFLHVSTNSQKLKVDRNFIGKALSNMGVTNTALGF